MRWIIHTVTQSNSLTCQTLSNRCLQAAGRGVRRGRLCQSANMHQPHHEQRICCEGKQADILWCLMVDCYILEQNYQNDERMKSVSWCLSLSVCECPGCKIALACCMAGLPCLLVTLSDRISAKWKETGPQKVSLFSRFLLFTGPSLQILSCKVLIVQQDPPPPPHPFRSV